MGEGGGRVVPVLGGRTESKKTHEDPLKEAWTRSWKDQKATAVKSD